MTDHDRKPYEKFHAPRNPDRPWLRYMLGLPGALRVSTPSNCRAACPEEDFAWGVLHQAVCDIMAIQNPKHDRWCRDIKSWIAETMPDPGYPFATLCEGLRVGPGESMSIDCLRDGLNNLIDRMMKIKQSINPALPTSEVRS